MADEDVFFEGGLFLRADQTGGGGWSDVQGQLLNSGVIRLLKDGNISTTFTISKGPNSREMLGLQALPPAPLFTFPVESWLLVFSIRLTKLFFFLREVFSNDPQLC